MRVLLATANQGKVIELERILNIQSIRVIGLEPAAATGELETGSSFEENALLKARYYFEQEGLPTVADDSGLEVDALGGAPGIYSARYGGPGAADADRFAKLLEELKGVPAERRGARFVCSAAFVWQGGEQVFTEAVDGMILGRPHGDGGFGYDPVFFYPPLGKTFAELTPEQKAEVSHRGRAFRRLIGWLKQSGVLDTA